MLFTTTVSQTGKSVSFQTYFTACTRVALTWTELALQCRGGLVRFSYISIDYYYWDHT